MHKSIELNFKEFCLIFYPRDMNLHFFIPKTTLYGVQPSIYREKATEVAPTSSLRYHYQAFGGVKPNCQNNEEQIPFSGHLTLLCKPTPCRGCRGMNPPAKALKAAFRRLFDGSHRRQRVSMWLVAARPAGCFAKAALASGDLL